MLQGHVGWRWRREGEGGGVPCQSRACPTPLLQPAVAVAKEPVGAVALGCGCGDRRGCWWGWLVTLGLGTHWHDDADAVFLFPPSSVEPTLNAAVTKGTRPPARNGAGTCKCRIVVALEGTRAVCRGQTPRLSPAGPGSLRVPLSCSPELLWDRSSRATREPRPHCRRAVVIFREEGGNVLGHRTARLRAAPRLPWVKEPVLAGAVGKAASRVPAELCSAALGSGRGQTRGET